MSLHDKLTTTIDLTTCITKRETTCYIEFNILHKLSGMHQT